MPCTATYSCLITQIGPLVYHNVIINGSKWHYPENTGGTQTSAQQIIKMIEEFGCNSTDLETIGFVKGWQSNCPE